MSYRNAKYVASNIEERLTGAKIILVAIQNDGTSTVLIPGIRPIITTLIAFIDKLMEKRLNHQGFDDVAREVSRLVDTIDSAMSKVKHEIEEITCSDPWLWHASAEGLRSSSLENHGRRLCEEFMRLKESVKELNLRWFYRQQGTAKLWWLSDAIKTCRGYFECEYQVALETSIKAMKEVVMENSYGRDEKILESLPHLDASYQAAGNARKSNFLPGTRVELFDAITDWVERRSQELSSKAVCILTGGAGTGKSTIASEFAQQRDDEGDYGASFFFVRGEADLDSTRLVFPTLAYQLAQSQEALRPHIVRAVREHLKRGKIQQMRFQASSLLHEPLHKVSDKHRPVVLVIDALDECSEECALVSEMLDRLIECVRQTQFPLRIFFTSRPNSIIESTLQHPQWAPLVHTISLDHLFPEFVQRDMAIVVRDKQPLDDHYLTVLENAFPPGDLSSDPALCQALESTLGSLAVLRTPLSPAVLEALTGVPRKDICNVLGRLRALVLFDETKPDEKVRAMHATFPQFLLDANRCMSPWYRVDTRCQHARLAAGCLHALQVLEENMVHLSDPTVSRVDILDLGERLGAHVPEHVQYACAHWAAHLGSTCELGKKHIGTACGCREIAPQLAAFARTKLGAWVEMMAYMGRLDTVKKALGTARAYLKGAPLYQEVDALFAGAQQLVVDHYSEIEDCPYAVHQARSIPDAFSSSLDWADGGSVEQALSTAPVYLKGAQQYQEVDALLVGAQQLMVDHESFLSSVSGRNPSTKTVLDDASLVEDDLDTSELVSEGSSQPTTTRQPIDDLTVSGTPFPPKNVSQSPSSDQAPADAASHTQHPCGPQEPSSISGSGAGSMGTPQYVPYSMGRYWQISETHRFAYTLESANYGWYRQISSESE